LIYNFNYFYTEIIDFLPFKKGDLVVNWNNVGKFIEKTLYLSINLIYDMFLKSVGLGNKDFRNTSSTYICFLTNTHLH